jgi:hypothetical protein
MNYTPSLPEGTHIAVKGLLENLHQRFEYLYPLVSPDGYYLHHGVYLGNCEVIHFFGENKADATPRICHIKEFRSRGEDNGAIYKVVYKNKPADLPLDKKREKVKKVWKYREKWPKYHITKNNCETFATYLTKGRGFSVQASNAMSYGITTISCILLGTIYYIKCFK